jgi:hypothetical protein
MTDGAGQAIGPGGPGGVGPDTVVRLTAAALADSRSIDPAAAIWVVGEFARALGYQVSDGLQPARGAAPAPPAPPAAVAPAVAVADAGPAPGVSPPVGPPGDDLTVPPTGVPHPATQRAGFGHQETVTTGQGAPQPGVQPAAPAGPPAGGGYGWEPGLAAGQGMPPPGAQQGMPPPGAPMAGGPMAPHACSPVQRPAFGATAEMHCVGGPKIPPDYVQYYLFSSTAAMNGAYSTFVTSFAQSHRDTGHCHQINGTSAFSTFSLGSTAEGRIAEYNYKGSPDISCTFTVDKVLVDMQASDGNTLIGWWDHSHNWIKS